MTLRPGNRVRIYDLPFSRQGLVGKATLVKPDLDSKLIHPDLEDWWVRIDGQSEDEFRIVNIRSKVKA